MNVSVPKEVATGERRVALVPEVVERLVQSGLEVTVESGAGEAAHHPDAAYEAAGARTGDGLSGDVVAKVAPPTAEEIGRLEQGSVLIGFLQPLTAADTVRALADRRAGAAALLPDAHHRGGHGAAGEGARARRRSGRPSGDRDVAPARRHRAGLRRALGREGADRVARRPLPRARHGPRGRRGRRRLRAPANRRRTTEAAGAPRRGDRKDGRGHID